MNHVPFARSATSAAVVLAAAACASSPQTVAYVETLGSDTMSVETFTRTGEGFEGVIVTRAPATVVARYVAATDADGAITGLSVEWSTPAENPEGPPPWRAMVAVVGDSAVTARTREETDTLVTAVPPGTLPVVPRSPLPVAFVEYVVRRAVSASSDSFPFTVLAAGSPRTLSNAIVRRGPDTVSFDYFGSPMYASVDGEGRVLGITGEATTRKVRIVEVPAAAVDVAALAADFGARDARGEGIGTPSPREQAQFTLGRANFEVDYGRPAMRGRRIFGGLVPFGEVWRTGANAATHFTTSRDITLGGERIPAGTYTLWSTYSEDGATLIVNDQTRQWGTAYDVAQDRVRIPLQHSSLDQPVERFTIAVEPTAEGGELALMWDESRFSVPIRVVR